MKQHHRNVEIEKRKAKHRLQKTSSKDIEISSDMIIDSMQKSLIDKLSSLLPKPERINMFHSNSSKWDDCKFTKAFNSLPMKPLKRNINWLSLNQQDCNSEYSLTRDLYNFSTYVQVCYIYLRWTNNITSHVIFIIFSFFSWKMTSFQQDEQ
jgi:hypothetical protein